MKYRITSRCASQDTVWHVAVPVEQEASEATGDHPLKGPLRYSKYCIRSLRWALAASSLHVLHQLIEVGIHHVVRDVAIGEALRNAKTRESGQV
jgi:hypothetical protein